MAAGKVVLLVIWGGNQLDTAPVDLRFPKHLNQVKLRVHLGLYDDETSALVSLACPRGPMRWRHGVMVVVHHGTVSLMQPLIAPLYKGKWADELLAVVLMGQPESDRGLPDCVRVLVESALW